MPIYEYTCRSCGAKFEKIVSSRGVEVACQQCGSSSVERLLSVFSVARSSQPAARSERGPCGTCGLAERGMCAGNADAT